MSGEEGPALHAGVAEHGKVCALRGDHVEALRHYREAMAMAARAKAPEVVLRHYLECSLESLEHMGAYAELVEYCDRALAHYSDHPPESALTRFDVANIHQRRGLAWLKLGDRAAATREFEAACAGARGVEAELPLSTALLRWLQAELTLSPERVTAEQARYRYFSVRKDTVRPAYALPLPGAASPAPSRSAPARGGP